MSSHANPTAQSVPLSVGLLGRRSLLGATVVLGIALMYILALPALNHAIKGEGDFAPGEPHVVGGNLQITPAPGWDLDDSSGLLTVLSKAGATFVPTPAVDNEQTAEELAQVGIDGLKADTSNTWVIGEPQTFVTDAGDHGVSVTAHTTDQTQMTWVILNGSRSATIISYSPDSAWPTLSPEMNEMAASVVFLDDEVQP